MEAASQGHLETVQYLLNCGADPLIGADDNAPPSFFACVHGFADVVEVLLSSGADPNALRDSDSEVRDGDSRGVSQLEIAVRHGSARIALALIDAGANIDHVSHGKTPLDIALETEMTAVADRIREVDRRRMQTRQTKLAEQDVGLDAG